MGRDSGAMCRQFWSIWQEALLQHCENDNIMIIIEARFESVMWSEPEPLWSGGTCLAPGLSLGALYWSLCP